MATFGINTADGTLSACKAKPENRGRGNCPHGDHVELSEAEGAPEVIQAYNDEKLQSYYGELAPPARRSAGQVAPPHPANQALTLSEFHQATDSISELFTQESWELLNEFYDNLSPLLTKRSKDAAETEIVDNVFAYLSGPSETAQKVRNFLGPEVELHTFSAILVNQVKGMVAVVHLRQNRRESLSRIVLTGVANDMTKRRYVASVLFFGGRCCYCKKVLTKKPGPSQATGEHLTPLSPEGEATVGVTRYGNMALACFSCNNDRENTELNTWMKETTKVKDSDKAASLSHIEAFRRFSLYEEYSPAQSSHLRAGVEELRREMEKYPKPKTGYTSETFIHLDRTIKAKIYELGRELNS